jgi:hypothetical protein
MSESNRIVILHQKQHTTRKRRSCSVSITGNPSCQTRESLIFAMLKSLTLLLFVFVGSWVMSTESRKLTKIEMIYVFAISINWWLFTVRENENRDFRFTFSFSFDYRTGLSGRPRYGSETKHFRKRKLNWWLISVSGIHKTDPYVLHRREFSPFFLCFRKIYMTVLYGKGAFPLDVPCTSL